LLLPAVLKCHVVREAECLGVQGMVLKHAGVATLREAIATVLAGGTYYCAQSSGMMKKVKGSRPASATARLTARELEVLRWIAEGKRNAEIAQILAITPATVKCHVEHLLEKLGVETRCAAAAKWLNG
jgi:DNA-binding NarL/FixJ family response regulator